MKNIRSAIFLLAAVVLAAATAWHKRTPVVKSAQAAAKPNIIIIMADDLDSRQLSCYGGQNLKTTNIDALAAEGVKFNKIFASEAICVPTRASLFTGRYPMGHGSYQNHKQVYTDRDLKSVCQYMSALGYRVGLTGKDHVTKPTSVFPFDIIKGFEPNCVSNTDDYYLDSVKQYITQKDKPYCLFVMSINPHAPWTVGDPKEFDPAKLVLPPSWVDTKRSRELYCLYLAEVRRLDNQVGDIMKMLKETGQDKNTMVIFLGEQGPQFPGGKWNSYDYGQKSSLIARFPGHIKAVSQSEAIVQYEDITPTLIDLAGGKPIAGLDGRSFLSALYGKTNTHRDYAYGIYNNIPEGKAYAMRSIRDQKYKLILNLSAPMPYTNRFALNPENKNNMWASWQANAKTPQELKLVDRIVNRPAVEFFDMEADPYELNNLADQPKYKAQIDSYTTKLKAWMAEQKDPGAPIDKPNNKNPNDKDN